MGRIRARLKIFRSESYFSFSPVLGAANGGAAMSVSPKTALLGAASRIFGSRSQRKEAEAKVFPRKQDNEFAVDSLVLYVDDDIEVVVHNYREDVSLEDLQPFEVISIIDSGFRRQLRDDAYDSYVRIRG